MLLKGHMSTLLAHPFSFSSLQFFISSFSRVYLSAIWFILENNTLLPCSFCWQLKLAFISCSSKYFACCRLCISGLWRNQRMMIFLWNCEGLLISAWMFQLNCLIEWISHAHMFFSHSSRSKLHTYDDVVERVARQLGLDDPAKIRLTSHNCYSQQPKPQPIKYRGVEHLLDMLIHYNQVNAFHFFLSIWAWFPCNKMYWTSY